jgi:hypothetical protein
MLTLEQKEAEAYLPNLASKEGRSLCMHDLLNAELWTFKYRLDKLQFFFGFSAMTMSYSANIIFVILHFTMFEPYNWANSSKRSKTA